MLEDPFDQLMIIVQKKLIFFALQSSVILHPSEIQECMVNIASTVYVCNYSHYVNVGLLKNNRSCLIQNNQYTGENNGTNFKNC